MVAVVEFAPTVGPATQEPLLVLYWVTKLVSSLELSDHAKTAFAPVVDTT